MILFSFLGSCRVYPGPLAFIGMLALLLSGSPVPFVTCQASPLTKIPKSEVGPTSGFSAVPLKRENVNPETW